MMITVTMRHGSRRKSHRDCPHLFVRNFSVEKSVTEQNFCNQLEISKEFEHDVKCSLCTNNSIARNLGITNTSDAFNGDLTDGNISGHSDECYPLNITNPDSNSASSSCTLAECMVESSNELAVSSLVPDEALLHGNDLKSKTTGYSGNSQKNGTSSPDNVSTQLTANSNPDNVSSQLTDDYNSARSSSRFATLNNKRS